MACNSGWKGEQTEVGISDEVNGTIVVTVSLPVTRVEPRLLVRVAALKGLVPVPEVLDRGLELVVLGELVVPLVLVVSPVLVPVVEEALLGMPFSPEVKLDEELPGPGPLPPFLTVNAFLTVNISAFNRHSKELLYLFLAGLVLLAAFFSFTNLSI